MFDPHMGTSVSSVNHHSEPHIVTNTVAKQSKGLNGDMKTEHKKKIFIVNLFAIHVYNKLISQTDHVSKIFPVHCLNNLLYATNK